MPYAILEIQCKVKGINELQCFVNAVVGIKPFDGPGNLKYKIQNTKYKISNRTVDLGPARQDRGPARQDRGPRTVDR